MKFEKWMIGCSLLSYTGLQAQQAVSHPNIIHILMDDLGYGDLQCYGQQKIETPHIDRLREDGMKFTQHYSGSPVSASSRCVLLTGLHSGHSQIRGNDEMAFRGAVGDYDSMYVHRNLEGQFPLKAETMTLGRMLQQAGYVTGCFGKWGLGYPGSEGTPGKQGFDHFFGYNCQRQAHTYYPAFLYENEERIYLRNRVMNPHTEKLDAHADPYDAAGYAKYVQHEYANDLIFDRLIRFVDQHRSSPFFLMWTTPLPHVSLQAPERWVQHYVQKFGDEPPYLGEKGYMPCRYPRATYAAMISYFDEQVGKLVEKLKAEGLYEKTLIVFTSDNGPTFNGGTDSPWFNSGGLFRSEYGWGKGSLHEGGIRVPAIFTWAGKIAANSESDHLSGFQDVMPTLADIAGIPSPRTDGISFLPTLLGRSDKQAQHPFLYWEFPEWGGEKAVRSGKWKALWKNIKKGNKRIMLFDLENDIKEEHDVADKYPGVVREMERLMRQSSTLPENKRFRM
ncbi:arylsulfatase [Bacteroides pyogenes]|uniref:arylsulfatase n=1 Tax=Bacteroides pyogenes TaxID=310300 RepID=UPI001F33DD16|nr:arylsulfatase [Bacteroides pyogenes]MCE9107719.1 arylsulfatase [Bacteroides pyogenes]